MSNKKEKPIRAIDRLSQKPYSDRDSSDAGVFGELMRKSWTVEEIQTRAQLLGKRFEPDGDTLVQLKEDLINNNIVVFFTEEDIKNAVKLGAVPARDEAGLMAYVSPSGSNDIVVFDLNSVQAEERDRLTEWFLFNNRC